MDRPNIIPIALLEGTAEPLSQDDGALGKMSLRKSENTVQAVRGEEKREYV